MLFETLDSAMLVTRSAYQTSHFSEPINSAPPRFYPVLELALDLSHLHQKNINKYSLRNPFKNQKVYPKARSSRALRNLQIKLENQA